MSPRRSLRLIAILAILAMTVASRWTERAIATSGGSPYQVPVVTDTNPDPDIVETTIVAAGSMEDIGNGVMANLLTFNGTLPGPEFRLKVGDTVIVHFQNNLGHASGVHWHGIELANASDGTPLTQNMVQPGDTFLYKFIVPRPGIYWYHPHHHSSTNQVFKGLYGSIIVTDPNEAALQASGTLPPANQTMTMVLSDLTVCKAVGSNDTETYDSSLPHVSGGPLPLQFGPTPFTLCEGTPIDEDGNPRGAYAAGDVPNIQLPGSAGAVNEGQTVVTNGMNVGPRAGTPSAPGALAPTAQTHAVRAGQGLRLQLVSSTTTRFFRLGLTDHAGASVPLVRVGGQGGLLDNARVEGGVVGGFNFNYGAGEILLDPGDRADVVVAIPAGASIGDVLTLWTTDFARTGGGFTNTPTVPVAHFEVTAAPDAIYTIANGTPLRAATGDPVPVLGAATGTLLNPAAFAPAKPGMSGQDIRLTNVPGTSLGVNGVQGQHDPGEPYSNAAHPGSTRYAKLGDTLQLTVTNQTGAHHPFHLHGFSIQPISLTRPGNPTYTFPYAEYRDNIDVPGNYTLTFRVRLDDRPLMDGTTLGGGLGRWVFHCHIFFHASFGMISEFDVVAPDGNERPYINANDTELSGLAATAFSVNGTYDDPDGDAVTLSASSGTITDNGGGNWTWTRTGGASGHVTVTSTDANGLRDQVVFDVGVNSLPALVLPAPPSVPNAAPVSFGISATDADAGDTVTLSASGLPAALTFTDNGNRTATVAGTPTAPAGVYTATLTANDGANPPVNRTLAITIVPATTLTGTKTVSGSFRPGGTVTYTVVLTNAGPAAQLNNPGNEFTDVLPAGLTLVSATATAGTAAASIPTRTITWNGGLAAGASVTITIEATIATSTASGTVLANQGTISFDADGNGTNEASALTDNPAVPGAANPTNLTVVNNAPTISGLADATIDENGSHSVSFTVGDDFTAAAALSISATSSNAALVATSGLVVSGSGASRTLTITPVAGASGSVTIAVTVGDGAQQTTTSLSLTVIRANRAPAISGLAAQTIEENTTAAFAFTIADDSTAAASLQLSATSSNATLVPDSALVLGGADGVRTLIVTPRADREGQTTITVTVGDGSLSTAVAILLTVTPAPPPQPPTLLAASVIDSAVRFTWTPPASGAVPRFYVLEGGLAPGLSTLPVINTPDATATATTTLPSGTYFFRVRSGNGAGTSAVSNEVVVRVETPAAVPGPPTGLVAVVADTQVTLNWRPPVFGGDAARWQLEVGTTSGGSEIGHFAVPLTMLSASGALAPGDYVARVRGVNDAGSGPASNETQFHVGALPACDPPDSPLLLPAAVSGRTVTLSWRPTQNTAIARYRLLIGSIPGGADLGIVDVGAVTAFAAEAAAGTYYATVLASNDCGTSNPSNTIEVVVGATLPPAAPADLNVLVDGSRVTITWGAVTGAISYLVEAGSTTGASDIATLALASSELVLETVPAGTYYVRVRAVGAAGAGLRSTEVIVVVP